MISPKIESAINSDAMTLAANLVNTYPDQISISLLQRHFRLGYSAALAIMGELISRGKVIDHGATANIESRYSLAIKK